VRSQDFQVACSIAESVKSRSPRQTGSTLLSTSLSRTQINETTLIFGCSTSLRNATEGNIECSRTATAHLGSWGVENDLIHRPWLACNRAVLIVAHDFACGFLKGRPYPGRKAEPTLEPLGPQGEKSPPWGQVRPKLATRRMWLARPPISSGFRILTNQRRRSRPAVRL